MARDWICNCARFCKIDKRVSKSTYYAHAPYRWSSSLNPIGDHTAQGQGAQGLAQAPPIADILAQYPPLNLGGQFVPQREVSILGNWIQVELTTKFSFLAQQIQGIVQPHANVDNQAQNEMDVDQVSANV